MSKAILLAACIMVGDGGGENVDVAAERIEQITTSVYAHLADTYGTAVKHPGDWCVYDAADSYFWHTPTDNVAEMLSAWAKDYGVVWPRGNKEKR